MGNVNKILVDIINNIDKYEKPFIAEQLFIAVTELSNSGANAGYASPSSSGVQNGGQWQKCPKCDGQGMVSKPPWIAGDVTEWTSTQTSYPCDLCGGMKVIKQ